MNSKNQKVLHAIFEIPVRANIAWADIEKLFIALDGEIATQGGSVITVKIKGHLKTFHRPHPQKEAKRWMVKEVRKLLEKIGAKP